MSSDSGMVATPFVSPYSASKFALEALSDSLRMELHPWHMQVSVVQPGAIDTPIWDKGGDVLRSLLKGAPRQGLELYGSAIRGMEPHYVAHGIATDAVAKAVAHALTASHPKTRYPIGTDGALATLLSWLPDRVRDRILLSQLPKWG